MRVISRTSPRPRGVAIRNTDPPVDLSFSSSFSDIDADGFPDLLVAADLGTSRLFWNDGDGSFTAGTASAGVGLDQNGMGNAVGDYDGDGDLDWFVTAIHAETTTRFTDGVPEGNRLYRNDGNRSFAEVAAETGVDDGDWGWGASFFDPDNDGDLDLVMTNGIRFEGQSFASFFTDPARLFVNQGHGVMSDGTADAGLVEHGDGKGLLVFDYDADGDQDVLMVNHVTGVRLWRNDTTTGNGYLRLKLTGTSANRQGIGAVVRVKVTADAAALVRELRGGSNFLGQNEPLLHFGLGPGSTPVAEVRILWPSPGGRKEQVLTNVARNQVLTLTEP